MALKSTYLKLTDDTRQRLDEIAERLGVTRSSVIKQIIGKGLENEQKPR